MAKYSFVSLFFVTFLAFVILNLFGGKASGSTLNGGLDVHFFDVGQGMSQLIGT